MENIIQFFNKPQLLNRGTLYELRIIVARYPYFDTARLLLVKNLYLLHSSDFGEELRRAAIYIKDRRALFNLIEGIDPNDEEAFINEKDENSNIDRTLALIESFLSKLPQDHFSLEAEQAAAIDYTSVYLVEKEENRPNTPRMRGQNLIDKFIEKGNEKISLNLSKDEPERINIKEINEYSVGGESEVEGEEDSGEENDVSENVLFSETLVGIYIQKREYEKAIEIIRQLNLEYPNKNRYFADQIRFLEKLVNHTKIK